jgi:hypothetical protein
MRNLKSDIVVPRVDRKLFTAGMFCTFEYAHRLSEAGHHVRVVSILPSPYRLIGLIDSVLEAKAYNTAVNVASGFAVKQKILWRT